MFELYAYIYAFMNHALKWPLKTFCINTNESIVGQRLKQMYEIIVKK